MSTHERPDDSPIGADAIPSPSPGAPTLAGAVTRRTWMLVLAASVIASAGSWLFVEGLLHAYKASFEPISKPYPSAEDIERITRARIVSGTLAFGATGGLLGLMLGLAGGVSRGSIKSAALSGMTGLLLGGLAEAGVAWLTLSIIYKKLDLQSEDMLQTLLCHEALWAVVGVAGGLAFGLGLGGRGRWWRAAVGGLIGAALATVVYEFVGALAFATHGTHQPHGDSMVTRALAQVLVPFGTAIGSILAARDPKGKPVSP